MFAFFTQIRIRKPSRTAIKDHQIDASEALCSLEFGTPVLVVVLVHRKSENFSNTAGLAPVVSLYFPRVPGLFRALVLTSS